MKLPQPLSLVQLAALLQAEYVGPDDFQITGINEIHMVEAGDLTFVDHPKYYDKALKSAATTILINRKMDCPQGKALIFSSDPFKDYLSLVKKFAPFIPSQSMIDPTAEIGEGTHIQPNVFVGPGVKIGKNCLIHSGVCIYANNIIGDNVIIHSNTVIGADAYYFQRRPEGYVKFESCGNVVIGNNVEIGALCSIDRGVSGTTTIGDGTKFDNHVQVGHDTYIGKNCLIGAHTAIAGVTRIEDDVVLWGRVAVNKDLVIGRGAVVLATSAVGSDLEPRKTYFGAPAIEARKKWREIAALRKLPYIISKLEGYEEK